MDQPLAHSNAVALVEASSNPLGVQLVSTKKTNKISEAADLVALAGAIQKADDFTKANVGSKLTVIAEQIQFLQNQAKKILEDARRDTALHHAACNMVKRPGAVYYLYRRESGQSYLSLLSPQEWGSSCPSEFLGGYRLEYDMSWTPISDIPKKDEENKLVDKIYSKQRTLVAESLDKNGLIKICNGTSKILDIAGDIDILQES